MSQSAAQIMENPVPTSFSIGLFPGQGSQHVGMAKELHDCFKLVGETFEEASDAVHVDLRKLCFDGPESDLTLTENTQPCLLAASVAAFRVATRELGFRPTIVAGHSLGEYSALVAAGALDLSTAAAWVRERGKAMQIAVPAGQGSMAAVLSMEDAIVSRLCETATANAKQKRAQGENSDLVIEAVVEPANFNAPGQIVIAGSKDAVAEALALIKSGGEFAGKAIPLSVSAPFHCRLMRQARDRMSELFDQARPEQRPRALAMPYVPNRTARPTQETGVVFDLLVEQVDHPVLWRQTIEELLRSHSDASLSAVEFGPGKVLTGLVKRIAMPLKASCSLFQMSESSHLKALETAFPRN